MRLKLPLRVTRANLLRICANLLRLSCEFMRICREQMRLMRLYATLCDLVRLCATLCDFVRLCDFGDFVRICANVTGPWRDRGANLCESRETVVRICANLSRTHANLGRECVRISAEYATLHILDCHMESKIA